MVFDISITDVWMDIEHGHPRAVRVGFRLSPFGPTYQAHLAPAGPDLLLALPQGPPSVWGCGHLAELGDELGVHEVAALRCDLEWAVQLATPDWDDGIDAVAAK
ncbi:MAG: hypothetical protein AAGA48_27690 [Myxococcota bacterium]